MEKVHVFRSPSVDGFSIVDPVLLCILLDLVSFFLIGCRIDWQIWDDLSSFQSLTYAESVYVNENIEASVEKSF